MSIKSQRLQAQQRALRVSRRTTPQQTKPTPTVEPTITEEQKKQLQEIKETKTYVDSEIKKLEESYRVNLESKNYYSRIGKSYQAQQVDITLIKIKGRMDALKEVQHDLNSGYYITKADTIRYADAAATSRSSAQKYQYETRALAEFQYERKLETYQQSLEPSTHAGITSQAKVQGKYVLGKGYEVRDSKGNLVGYDTGTQSIPATESEKVADKLARGAYKENKVEDVTGTGLGDITVFTPVVETTLKKETYQPESDLFVSTAKGVPDVSMSTLVMRPPPPTEQVELEKIKERKEKQEQKFEKSVLYPIGTAGQMIGGIFTTPITEEEKGSISGLSGFLNPFAQYKIYKNYQEWKKGLNEAKSISDKLEKLNKDIQKVEDDYNAGKIDYNEYARKFRDYEKKFNYYSKNKNYHKVISQNRTTLYQDIANTNFTETKKAKLSGLVAVTDAITYIEPSTRFIRGIGMVSGGISDKSRIDVVLGGTIAVSSFIGGGLIKGGSGKISKVIKKAGGLGFTGGVSGVYGYQQFKQTGSIGVGIGSSVGFFAGLQTPNYSQLKNNWKELSANKRGKAGKKAQKQKVVTKKKTEKKKKEKVYVSADEYLFTKRGNVLKEKTYSEKLDKVREDIIKIAERGSEKDFKEYYDYLKKIYGEAETKRLISEVLIQEGYTTPYQRPEFERKVTSNIFDEVAGVGTGKVNISAELNKGRLADITLDFQKISQPQKEVQKEKQNISLVLKNVLGTDTTQITKQEPRYKLGNVLITSEVPKLIEPTKQTLIGISPLIEIVGRQQPRPKKELKPPPPIIIGFPDFGKELFPIPPTKQQGYNVYVKGRKISDVPMTRDSALSFGSWAVDNTLSAQFNIKKTKAKPRISKYKFPDMNWTFVQNKFRDYEMSRKRKIPLRNKFIEKKQFRLDTPSEVSKISVARFLSQQKRKSQQQKVNLNFKKILGF